MINTKGSPGRASSNPVMGLQEWLLLGVLSVLWGGSFVFVGVIVRELPPFTLVLVRASLAALALISVVRLSGATLPVSLTLWTAFLAMAVVNSLIPYSLIAWGQQHIDSVRSSTSGVVPGSVMKSTTRGPFPGQHPRPPRPSCVRE